MIRQLFDAASILDKQQTVRGGSRLVTNISEVGSRAAHLNQCSVIRFAGLKVGLLGIQLAVSKIKHGSR